MKCIKEYGVCDTVTSTKEPDKNFSKSTYSICGKNNCDEYKILVKLDIRKIRELSAIKDNVKKVELCYSLYELSIDKCSEAYMINMGINLEDFSIEEANANNAPKFYQECCIYKLKKAFVGEYINFDITHIVKGWIDKKNNNYGITIIGLNAIGIACFNSPISKEKPYIKIHYNKEYTNCNNVIHKNEVDNRVIDEKAYGYFINKSGDLKKNSKCTFICWDRGGVSNNINIGCDTSTICIKEKGIYQIDYGVNLRSHDICIMQIEVNKSSLLDTRIQVGSTEGMSYGNTILDIKCEESLIELKIIGEEFVLANIGVKAYIRIIKI